MLFRTLFVVGFLMNFALLAIADDEAPVEIEQQTTEELQSQYEALRLQYFLQNSESETLVRVSDWMKKKLKELKSKQSEIADLAKKSLVESELEDVQGLVHYLEFGSVGFTYYFGSYGTQKSDPTKNLNDFVDLKKAILEYNAIRALVKQFARELDVVQADQSTAESTATKIKEDSHALHDELTNRGTSAHLFYYDSGVIDTPAKNAPETNLEIYNLNKAKVGFSEDLRNAFWGIKASTRLEQILLTLAAAMPEDTKAATAISEFRVLVALDRAAAVRALGEATNQSADVRVALKKSIQRMQNMTYSCEAKEVSSGKSEKFVVSLGDKKSVIKHVRFVALKKAVFFSGDNFSKIYEKSDDLSSLMFKADIRLSISKLGNNLETLKQYVWPYGVANVSISDEDVSLECTMSEPVQPVSDDAQVQS